MYDLNKKCSAVTGGCKGCAAVAGCVWCDTGAAAGGLVSTGSCGAGPDCIVPGVKPTLATDAKCTASASSLVFGAAAMLVAALAAF